MSIQDDQDYIRQSKAEVVAEFFKTGCPKPVEIKAGPELDKAVAEAVGLDQVSVTGSACLITPREWDKLRGIEHLTCEGNVACLRFSPSTDLNAAIAVAVKAGVFDEWLLAYGWTFVNGNDCNELIGVCHPTVALAICAAILKLKKKKEELS